LIKTAGRNLSQRFIPFWVICNETLWTRDFRFHKSLSVPRKTIQW